MTEWSVVGYTRRGVLRDDGLGSAVLARHDASTNPVVIRYLLAATVQEPGFRARLRTDARLLADLSHPAVARLLESVESDRGIAVVREHINGRTVRALLGEEGAIGPEAALVVLDGVLRALDVAHSRGVLHRDCSPATVAVTRDGRVAVADFGIAGTAARESLASRTPFYLAPEHWGSREVGPQADLYAAAATCFECLAGAPPFFADDLATLRRCHESTSPPVEAVPAPVRDLLRRGLAKAPADRPVDAATFLAELEVAAEQGYGPGWAERGRAELAELAAGPRQPFRLDPRASTTAAAARSVAGGFQLGRPGRVAAAAATFALVLAALHAAVTLSVPPAGDDGGTSYGRLGIVPLLPGPDGRAPVAGGRDSTDPPRTAPAPAVVPAAMGFGIPPPAGTGPDLQAAALSPAGRYLGPSGPTAAPRTDVTTATVRSFERRAKSTVLVVAVATNGTGPVQVLLDYRTGRWGDPGSTQRRTVTKTLSGSTSYVISDQRLLPEDCVDYSAVTVVTTPAAGNGSQSKELDLSPCGVPISATPRSAPPPPPTGTTVPTTSPTPTPTPTG